MWRSRYPQSAPRWRRDGPRLRLNAPKRSQDPLRTAQYGSKMLSKCFKMSSRPLKIGTCRNIEIMEKQQEFQCFFLETWVFVRVKTAQGRPKMARRLAKTALRRRQDGPRWRHDALKMGTRRAGNAFRCVKGLKMCKNI